MPANWDENRISAILRTTTQIVHSETLTINIWCCQTPTFCGTESPHFEQQTLSSSFGRLIRDGNSRASEV
jgi:hypothetical protein